MDWIARFRRAGRAAGLSPPLEDRLLAHGRPCLQSRVGLGGYEKLGSCPALRLTLLPASENEHGFVHPADGNITSEESEDALDIGEALVNHASSFSKARLDALPKRRAAAAEEPEQL